MTTNDAVLREKFEAWAKLSNLRITRYPDENPDYIMKDTHSAWQAFQFAWQASAEAGRGRVIEVARSACFHYWNCENVCPKAQSAMAQLAVTVGFSDPAVDDEIAAILNRTASPDNPE